MTYLPIAGLHYNLSIGTQSNVSRMGSCLMITRFAPAHPSPRVTGLDVARCLAILGMMGAHMLQARTFPLIAVVPDNWDAFLNPATATLFTICAGVAMTLMTRNDQPPQGTELLQLRMRIAVRAMLLFLAGSLLQTFSSNVAVILEYLAAAFVLVLPVLGWPRDWLLRLAIVLAIGMPFVHVVVGNAIARESGFLYSESVMLLQTGEYPALILAIYMVIGLAIGRFDLASFELHRGLLALGAAMTVTGYGLSWILQRLLDVPHPGEIEPTSAFDLRPMLSASAHSGTWFDVEGSAGLAMVVLASSLIVAERFPRLVHPFVAAGTMSLTIYCLHVISMHWIKPGEGNQYAQFAGAGMVALVGATIWKRLVGPGPLEWVLSRLSHAAARIAPPPG